MKKILIIAIICLCFSTQKCYTRHPEAETDKNCPPRVLTEFIGDGWYTNIFHVDSIDETCGENYDLVLIYTDEFNEVVMEDVLTRADKGEMKVILSITGAGSMRDGDYKDFYQVVKDKEFEPVRKMVRKYADHPSVIGWNIFDEPDVHNVDPDVVHQLYKIVKEEDPDADVYTVFGHINKIEKYNDTFDVLMFDFYPYFEKHSKGKVESLACSMSEKADFLRNYVAEHNKKGFIFVLQGYGRNPEGEPIFFRRDPTPHEYRYMLYTVLIRQPSALLNWAFHISRKDFRESVIYPVQDEYEKLIPVVMQGEYMSDRVDVSNEAIRYNYSIYNGEHYLIAVNQSDKRIEADIEIYLDPTSCINVVSENRNITRLEKELEFKDVFEPFDVHIYKWK